MFFNRLYFTVSVLILSALLFTGCSGGTEKKESIHFETYTVPINIYHHPTPVRLSLVSELPGMLRLIGYSGSDFITGTFEVSKDDWIPVIEEDSNSVSLIQKATTKIREESLTNLWKLRISNNQPLQLEIHNMNAEGHWNFSGLPITDIYADLGTVKNAFTFDEVNPNIMHNFELYCGTGEVTIEGILNAVCQNMIVKAGEGNLNLRFNGKELLQSLKIEISTDNGIIFITIPKEIPAYVVLTGNSKVIHGEGIIKPDSAGNNVFETESYHGFSVNIIEISITGGSSTVYINAQL